jgi:ADP-ribosyl-[dinitrogen reductase] hydrolase
VGIQYETAAHGQAHSRKGQLSRAQGCLLGQLAGDSLGSLVEFESPEAILHSNSGGVRRLEDGGCWDTIAGQPTDDSEMALMLARMLAERGRYDLEEARKAYIFWLRSNPFDCGTTVSSGLNGYLIHDSQANGAMMRVSPLGIFGSNHPLENVSAWAMEDARLTHPHPICQQANSLFAMAIAYAVLEGPSREKLYAKVVDWAEELQVQDALRRCIDDAATDPPRDYTNLMGWVLIGFQNALWQLLYAANLEEGVVDTVMRGGDTDTNAAIAGALLGAVYGEEAIPRQWVDSLLQCRPEAGRAGVHRPRPRCFWPVDALELAERLLEPNRV